jgi:hypothetical protein
MAAALAGAAALTPTSARADVISLGAYQQYTTHQDRSKCIDAKTENPAIVQLWRCSGASEQKWQQGWDLDRHWFQLKNKAYATCIDVNHAGTALTGGVLLAGCSGLGDNTYLFDKWGVDYAFNDGHWFNVWYSFADASKCLARVGGASANGTRLTVAPCDTSSPSQQWDI